MSYVQEISQYHEIRIESKGHGATYAETSGFTVYGFLYYPESSVLVGQEGRCWLGHYETIEEAKKDFPTAVFSGSSSYRPYSESRPSWCTAEYEAETGERWSDD